MSIAPHRPRRALVPLSSATELSRVEDGLSLPLLVWAPGPRLADAVLGRPGRRLGGAALGHERPGPVGVPAPRPVNAVTTATEAKAQALRDAGVDGSGTPADAVCIAAPQPLPGQAGEAFTGPRSTWGARLARAVHRATYDACVRDLRARGAAGHDPAANTGVRRGG